MTVKTNKVITPEVDVTNASGYKAIIKSDNLTADRTVQFQDSDAIGASLQNVQDGAADKPAYVITSTASQNGIDLGDSDQFSFTDGSGNDRAFSFLFVGRFASLTSGAYQTFVTKYNNIGAEREWYCQRQPTGEIRFAIVDTSGNAPRITTTSNYSSKDKSWGSVVGVYDGSESATGLSLYVDGVSQAVAALASPSYTGMSNTAARMMVGTFQNTYTAPWSKEFNRVIIFNYALPAEKVARYSAGAKLDYEDIGGSNTEKITNGTFASSTGWDASALGTGGGISGGQCTFGYGADRSLIQTNADWVSGYTSGKRYRLTYTIVNNTLAGTYTFEIGDSYWHTGSIVLSNQVALTSTPGTYSVEFTCDNPAATQFRLGILGTTTSGTMVIDNVSIIQLGAVLDLEPEGIGQGPGWLDSSGNNLHGTATNCAAINTPAPVDARNYVINGNFDFWQRGTSFPSIGAAVYTADRWYQFSAVGATTSRVTGTYGPYGCKVQRDSGHTLATGIYLCSCFETNHISLLRGKFVTLSFWGKKGANYSGSTAGIGFQILTGTGTEGKHTGAAFTGLVNVATGNAAMSTTFQKYTVTGVVPSDATQMEIRFYYTPSGTAGADDSFTIEQVMLNVGPTPALFQRAGGDIAGELALCQRYCEKVSSDSTYGVMGFGSAYSTSVAQIFVPYKVQKRGVPTLYSYTALRIVDGASGYSVTSASMPANSQSTYAAWLETTVSGTPLTQFRPYMLVGDNNSSAALIASSEI